MRKYTEIETKAFLKRLEKRKARKNANKQYLDSLNYEIQCYRGLKLQLVRQGGYQDLKAKRFYINESRHMIWIPNSYLDDTGTIIGNIDWILKKWDTRHKIELSIKELKFGGL